MNQPFYGVGWVNAASRGAIEREIDNLYDALRSMAASHGAEILPGPAKLTVKETGNPFNSDVQRYRVELAWPARKIDIRYLPPKEETK